MIKNNEAGKYEGRSLKCERARWYFGHRPSYFGPRTSYFGAAALSVATVAWLSAQPTPSRQLIRGFSAAASAAEAARERELKAMPDAKAAEADFDVMTAEPHHTGSPYEIKLADYVSDQFTRIGIESTKYEYSVLLPWPKQRRIDIVAPDQVRLEVEEEKIRGDQWADNHTAPAVAAQSATIPPRTTAITFSLETPFP